MTDELFRAITRTNHTLDRIADIEETILATSQYRAATAVLLIALRDATLKHEELWQNIERMLHTSVHITQKCAEGKLKAASCFG